jgi:hypothetical protein
MSNLHVRPVFGSRPSLLQGSYTGLLLEHTHEPLREVRFQVRHLPSFCDQLRRM